MEIKFIEAAFDAILFASGEPVSIEKLAMTLTINKAEAIKIINNYRDKKNSENSGVKIIQLDNCYQMVARPEFIHYIRETLEIKRNTPLSGAAMEVLAIIAYNQPVTKGYIEQVRGVDSSGVTNSLLEKGLIEERGRMDVPGRPILYGTTLQFLKCFGLSSLTGLPKIEKSEVAACEESSE
jgi:segregation and condensation protein B